MASVAGSIPVASSKSLPRGGEVVSRKPHKLEIGRSNRPCATNPRQLHFIDAIGVEMGARTGKVTFAATRPDQFSHSA